MMLTFRASTEIVQVKIDDKRQLLFSGRMTNNTFIPFRDMIMRSGQQGLDADIAERRMKCLHCLPDDKSLEHYVIDEMRRAGLVHLKTEW